MTARGALAGLLLLLGLVGCGSVVASPGALARDVIAEVVTNEPVVRCG